MPYQLIWEPHGSLWEFFGFVTADEVNAANEEFFNDPRSDNAQYQLIDNLRVTNYEWDAFNIRQTAAFDKGASCTCPHMQVAFVSVNPDAIAAFEHYVALSKRLKSTWSFGVFPDLESARDWLKD